MNVVALILDGPLTRDREPAARAHLTAAGTIGASLRFEGVVRRGEPSEAYGGKERPLAGLNYQTYDPMAQNGLEELARDVASRHALTSITVLHSRGRVAVGEVSFVLEVTAPHRVETLNAVAEFIDRMKQDVPIWKTAVWQ